MGTSVTLPFLFTTNIFYYFQNVSRLMVSEGDSVQLTVVRTAGAFGEVTIDYEIPESIDDISPSTGSVTFIEGQR